MKVYGRKVLALHRSKIGNIGVKDLQIGTWRYLKQSEVDELLKNWYTIYQRIQYKSLDKEEFLW